MERTQVGKNSTYPDKPSINGAENLYDGSTGNAYQWLAYGRINGPGKAVVWPCILAGSAMSMQRLLQEGVRGGRAAAAARRGPQLGETGNIPEIRHGSKTPHRLYTFRNVPYPIR